MIRARTTPDLKEHAERIFDKLGLTASEAINIFYSQVRIRKGLPFEVAIPNRTTRLAIEDARKRRNLMAFSNTEDMIKDALS